MAIHIRRREFILTLGGAAAAWLPAARAQQSDRVRRIGVLTGFAEHDPAEQSQVAAFRSALTKLGWVEGSNLRIELRSGGADPNRARTLAKELVGLQPDAILGLTTLATSALAVETRTIPIVFAVVADPIGNGFVASLARPGGNLTGFTSLDNELGGKWVGLLREIAPRTERVALLFNPSTAMPFQFLMPSIQAAASSYAVEVSAAPVRVKDEIEGTIATQARTPGGGLIVMPDVFNTNNRDLIIEAAAQYAIPAMYFNPTYFAESGGLIGYSDDYAEECRLAAGYMDRILKGQKPADLPVQTPTKYQLIINLKTAKALGLSVPPGLLAITDQVIE
jgi:putative tryptophan/tyrosine transport system substrate-binding protein